ncbi:MAG: sigma-70 family RNA polymerase sigma factor [Clostridiales bacterium]|nr:sigma-70 family RNA polymerase sigma factor [Clostridiales bacterium]
MIDNERAMELFRKYRQTGDIKIRNELVENFIWVAEILSKKFSGRGVEYDDLLQISSEALISGVEKYDPDLGFKFTTYVTPIITGTIKNYFRDFSRTVRLPRKIYLTSNKINEASAKYYEEYGVKPTVKQLAQMVGVSQEEVIEALECKTTISLDAKAVNKDTENTLKDIIPDYNDRFDKFEMNDSLKVELEKLEPVERDIVELRFLQNKSQTEVGKILGVNQMFVSRAERRIIKKLKEALS